MNPVILCTLFDINYVDKGLALFQSLERCEADFILYVLAMDERVKSIIEDINSNQIRVIDLEQILKYETSLSEKKQHRTKGEFCWTCTPILIEYVLQEMKAELCTYVDSDLFFYSSPRILINEFIDSKKAVGLTPHRFPDTVYGNKQLSQSGKYCVEFNTFRNCREGRRLLKIWKDNVLKKCSIDTGGDQLYLSDWGEKYSEVYDYQNIGGGVAPWNICNYRFRRKNDIIRVVEKKLETDMVFYHFQGIQYSDDGRININVFAHPDAGFVSHNIVNLFYIPYLNEIDDIRIRIKHKYGHDFYADGCGRTFSLVKFNFVKFVRGFVNRLKNESVLSAIDLVFRVIRKHEDIIRL